MILVRTESVWSLGLPFGHDVLSCFSKNPSMSCPERVETRKFCIVRTLFVAKRFWLLVSKIKRINNVLNDLVCILKILSTSI